MAAPDSGTRDNTDLLAWLQGLDVDSCQSLPLVFLYGRVSRIHRQADAIRRATLQQGGDLTSTALSVCRALVTLVDTAGLFSSNEEAEDIATPELKYLLAPYYLAEVLASSPAPQGSGPSIRAQMAQEAISNYTAYLQRCYQYGLLSELSKRQFEQDEQTSQPSDAHSKRAAKVERFKADKALKAALSALEHKKAQAHALREQDASEQGPVGGSSGWDEEEDERQLWTTSLQAAALTSLGQREMLGEELKLLQHAPSSQAPQGAQQGGRGDSDVRQEVEEQQRQEVLDQLRKIAVDLRAAGNKRQQLQAEVFRPSYTLPTRTLEEQAHIEVEDAQRREQAERAAQEAEEARREALGDEGRDDEDTLKARAWDDWKDSNPRGWGNSKLRPCG